MKTEKTGQLLIRMCAINRRVLISDTNSVHKYRSGVLQVIFKKQLSEPELNVWVFIRGSKGEEEQG